MIPNQCNGMLLYAECAEYVIAPSRSWCIMYSRNDLECVTRLLHFAQKWMFYYNPSTTTG